MTRKEEIEIAIPKNKFGDFHSQVAYEFGFQQGAEWADKTMLDEIREWLNLHVNDYIFTGYLQGEPFEPVNVNNLINDLTKAMEE